MAETARLMVDKTTTVLCQHLQKAHIEYLRSYPNLNYCIQADNGYETFKISFKLSIILSFAFYKIIDPN